MQSGIEIAVCCQHQLLKHILDKVRYDFFAAAGGGFKQRCRAAGHGISGGCWGDGSAEGFVDRTSDRAGYEPDQPGGSGNTAAERWIGIGKFINKTGPNKLQTFLNKFWKVREQAGKFSMKAHVSLISHIKNEGISHLLVWKGSS